jgi:hypothetical protein
MSSHTARSAGDGPRPRALFEKKGGGAVRDDDGERSEMDGLSLASKWFARGNTKLIGFDKAGGRDGMAHAWVPT